MPDNLLSPVTPQELRQDSDDLDPLVPYHPEIKRHLLAAADELERQERTEYGKVRFGKRDDGSMWLSIGIPESGPHMQADWEFGEHYARVFAQALERQGKQ